MWRSDVLQGGHLVPLQDQAAALLGFAHVPPTPPQPLSLQPRQGLAQHSRGWHLWPGVRAPGSFLFDVSGSSVSPPRGADPAVGLPVPTLMAVCLSVVSVLGLPGPASGWLGLGVQPPPAAHAAAHLPGGGPLLHQQAQAGRVAGTLEKGGEAPSGLGPGWCHGVGNPEAPPAGPRPWPVPFGLTSRPSGDCSTPRQGVLPWFFQHMFSEHSLSIGQCARVWLLRLWGWRSGGGDRQKTSERAGMGDNTGLLWVGQSGEPSRRK